MRMGLGGGKTPPHKAAGYGLIALGGIIVVLAMPLSFYVAVIGGLVAYVGYTLLGK